MSIIIENEYEGEINIPYEKIAHDQYESARSARKNKNNKKNRR